MSDLISRQAAIDAVISICDSCGSLFCGECRVNYPGEVNCKKVLEALPSAQPQRTGRWIFDKNDYLTKCSECGCHPWFGVIPTVKEATKKMPHCPMCLAKMEENDEDR